MKILQKILMVSALLFVPVFALADNAYVVKNISAFNDTKNISAQNSSASKEDYLTFTLKATNRSGAEVSGYVFSTDLSGVLSFADVVDKGGAVLNGSMLTFPQVSIPANGSVTKSFQVRVKYYLADNLNYNIVATFGDTITIDVNEPKVLGAFVAPTTGADSNALAAFGFAFFCVGMYSVYKHVKAFRSYKLH